jgi:hypothetical protein
MSRSELLSGSAASEAGSSMSISSVPLWALSYEEFSLTSLALSAFVST